MAVWSFFWWLVAGLTKITTPRRPGRGLKPSKMDSPCQKTPSLTPQPSLNSLWGRNGEKLYFRWCWWSFCWWLVAWLIKIYNQPSPLPTGHSAPWGRPDREKCRIIGFDTCRVHFWGFQTSPTPSGGQKVRKKFSDPKKGPKMGSKVPYLIRGIARNGINYLPCDFGPNLWRVNFREILQGYPLAIFTKIDPSRIWLKIAGKVVIAISSNSTNKIGYFWAHFGPQNSKNIQKRPPPPQKRQENLKQPFLAHFWSKWAGFLHEPLLSHTLSGKLVTAPTPNHPPTHPVGLPPVRPPLEKVVRFGWYSQGGLTVL